MTFPFFQIKETDIENTLNIFIRDLEADINVNSPDCYALGKIKHSTNTKGKGVERVMSYWHLNKASSIIHENYPEFSVWFDKALNASWFYACNIIIAKTEIFDDYCKTMFGILNKYHSFMNNGIKDGEINNAMFRDSGYLGEIITSAYIMMLENKGFCVKHLGLSQVDVSSDESQKGTSIKAFLKNIF